MSMSRTSRLALALLALLCVTVTGFSRTAGAVDVSGLSDFENDPCVMAMSERNTAQHVDAPDSALSEDCDRAHGNVEVAWDILLRTWQPREIPGAYTAPWRPNAPGLALAIVQMLLAYAVLGAPVRGITALLRPVPGAPARPRRLAAEAVLSLLARLGIGALLLAVLMLPFAKLVAALALVAAIAEAARRQPWRASAPLELSPPSAPAAILAGAINDLAASAAGLLAVALIARNGWPLLGLGLVLAVVASIPAARRARRALRRNRWGTIAAIVLLAASVAVLGLSGPPVARAAGHNFAALAAVVSIVFALAALWRAGLLETWLPRRRQLSDS